jgi:hypothetical protein
MTLILDVSCIDRYDPTKQARRDDQASCKDFEKSWMQVGRIIQYIFLPQNVAVQRKTPVFVKSLETAVELSLGFGKERFVSLNSLSIEGHDTSFIDYVLSSKSRMSLVKGWIMYQMINFHYFTY